jgi:hypothetical protein
MYTALVKSMLKIQYKNLRVRTQKFDDAGLSRFTRNLPVQEYKTD